MFRLDEGMSMTPEASVVFQFDGAPWSSTISFDPGIPVMLGGNLELRVPSGVKPDSLVGETLQLFDWTGVSLSGQFAQVMNDLPYAYHYAYHWDTSHLYTLGEVRLVPEPSALVLLSIGAVAIAVCTWRRYRAW